MGRLAGLAKAKALKGAITVTDENGLTHTYANEAAAEAATAGKEIEHRRGAFFVKTAAGDAPRPKKK
jgi:hypothetical protein